MKEAHDHHRVTPEGRALGVQMARLADKSVAQLAAEGEPDARCKTCAFRAGTVPNGCLQTQADALKAVVEKVPFMCHQNQDARGRYDTPCHGWYAARVALRRAEERKGPLPVTSMPWEFSPPDPVMVQVGGWTVTHP